MSNGQLRRRGASARLVVRVICAAAALGVGLGRAGTDFSPCGISAESGALVAPDGAPGDAFGSSVAVNATTAVAGAPNDDAPEADRGSASVFRFDPLSGWVFAKKLEACPADLNHSGSVTGADLALLLGSWGLCP